MPYCSPPHVYRVSASNSKDARPKGGASLSCRGLYAAISIFTREVRYLEIPLGRNIRRLRIMNQMTQRELAFHLRVSVQAVSKWERGAAFPDLTLLLPIAELFSVTLDELFGREESE